MIIQKTAWVHAHYTTREWYESKGYNVPKKQRELFEVKVEDLFPGASTKVECQCDYCGKKHVMRMYNRVRNEKKVSCNDCSGKKRKETLLTEHGVEYIFQIPEVIEKIQNTQQEHRKDPEYCKDVKAKREATFAKNHDGHPTPFHIPEVVKKAQDTREQLYGSVTYFKNASDEERHEWQKKCAQTRYENNTTQTSPQQIYLQKVLGGVLNYPIDSYNLDIYFPEGKIDVEFDGFGHFFYDDYFNRDTTECDEKRDNILFNQGIRIIRFISKEDVFPIKENIEKLFEYAKSLNEKKVVIDIDNEVVLYGNKQIPFKEIL